MIFFKWLRVRSSSLDGENLITKTAHFQAMCSQVLRLHYLHYSISLVPEFGITSKQLYLINDFLYRANISAFQTCTTNMVPVRFYC